MAEFIRMQVGLWYFGDVLGTIKGFVFVLLLFLAGYTDIKTRTMPDIIHVLIICMGCIHINLTNAVVGFIIVPLPFFIMAYVKENSIGGGDVKLMAACGFFLGATYGMIASIVGLLLAVLVHGSYYIVKRIDRKKSFPLGVYLGIGSFIALIMKGV